MPRCRVEPPNEPTSEFPGVDIDSVHKLAAHKRLQLALSHRTRTVASIYREPEPHNRRPRAVDGVLAAEVKALIDKGYSPSTIRSKLHCGYSTIRSALRAFGIEMVGHKCQR